MTINLKRKKPMNRGTGFKAKARTDKPVTVAPIHAAASLPRPRQAMPLAVMATAALFLPFGRAVQKPVKHEDDRFRESARGEECTVRIDGCIGYREPMSVIASHFRGAAGGKGAATKAHDVCIAYACTYCDLVYDGQRQRPAGWTKTDVDLAWYAGHMRTLGRLVEKGLLP